MNDVLEKPMSATHYRTGRDNFEITASLVQLLDVYKRQVLLLNK